MAGTDTFPGTFGAPIPLGPFGPYTDVNHDWTNSGSNSAVPGSGAFDELVVDTGHANNNVSAEILGNPGGNNVGLTLRWSDSLNWWRVVCDGSNTYIDKMVAGSLTNMATYSSTGDPTGIVVECDMSGNVFTVKFNGTTQGTVTDSFNNTATVHGLGANNSSTALTNLTFSSFNLAPLPVITTFTALVPLVAPFPPSPPTWYWFNAVTSGPQPVIPPREPVVNGAASGSGAPGGLWADPTAAPLALQIVDRSDLSTVLSSLANAHDRQWQDTINDAGSGSIQLAASDADNALLTSDAAVRFLLYGRVVFTMLVENWDQMTVSPNEETDQVNTVTGRGQLALLEQACVYPSRGVDKLPIEDDRAYNWTAPSSVYDDSGWRFSTVLCSVATAETVWPQLPFASGFPDPTADVIWASSGTILLAPEGTCYFRKDITVPADGYYQMCALADNSGVLYIDGQQVLPLGGFSQTYTFLIFLSAGTHTIAASVTNDPFPVGLDNPACFVFAIYESSSSGELVTLIAHTDSTWKIVEYPPFPPGMTPGQVLVVSMAEAQARGTLAGFTLTFDGSVDSNGVPWPVVGDIATKVGTDYLSFFIEIANTYIDLWVSPSSLTLYAYNRGTRGVPTSIDYRASRTVTDGTVTASTVAIESATASFDSTDVGRRIVSDGEELLPDTTIVSITDASHATISAAARLSTSTGVWSIEGTISSLEHTKTL